MNNIIRQIREALIENGMDNVYSAFDARPVRDKGRIFTLVGIRTYEAMDPIYTAEKIYLPFKAEAEIKLTAPESTSQVELYDLYTEKAEGAMDKLTSMHSRLRVMNLYTDKRLGRQVLTALLRICGMRVIERNTEENSTERSG